MALPKILYTDLSLYTFTDVTGPTITGYELYNLYNYQQSSQWQGLDLATTSSQYLTIDIGELKEVDTIVIDNTNINTVMSSGSVSLEYATNSSFTIGLNTIIPDMSVFSDSTISYTFSPITKRYFRLNFNGQLSDYARVGNIFINKALIFDKPMIAGYKVDNFAYNTNEFTTLTGTTINNAIYPGRIKHEISFRLLNDTTRTNFINFVKAVRGQLLPFYFYDMEENISYVNIESDYIPVATARYGQNSIDTLPMIGNRATQATTLDTFELVNDNEYIV